MERQSKHRILGMLVIIGLVIIFLPLFQDGKEQPVQTTLVKSPPFPDQSTQVESGMTEVASQDTNKVQIQLTHNDVVKSESAANQSQADQPPIINQSKPIETSDYRIIEGNKAALKKNKHNSKSSIPKNQSISSIQLPEDKGTADGLINLKSAVWVLQIGSFKDKENALRIVNQLRAKGYRAFIQQMSTAMGEHTRVFVGPEYKQATAHALADRLRSELHIQAMVVNYKPLAL